MPVLMEPGEEETILERGGQSVVDQMVQALTSLPRDLGLQSKGNRKKNDVVRLQTMSVTIEVRMVLTITFRDSSEKHGGLKPES